MYIPEDLGQYLCPFTRKVFQLGYANLEQIQHAVAKSNLSAHLLPQTLEEITGKPLPVKLLRDYKKYRLFELKIFYGIEALDLDINPVAIDLMANLIESLIPIEVCRIYRLLPVKQIDNTIVVAMVNPDNFQAQDDLRLRLQVKQKVLRRKVIDYEDYDKLLSDFYHYYDNKIAEDLKKPKSFEQVEIESELQQLLSETDISERVDKQDELEYTLDETYEDQQAAPLVRLVNKILIRALQEKVSEVLIEPQAKALFIFFRKNKVIKQAFEPMPKNLNTAMINRLKIITKLDITKRNVKQNGKIKLIFNGKNEIVNINIIPSIYGEKVILEIGNHLNYFSSETRIQTSLEPLKLRIREIEKLLEDASKALQQLKEDVENIEGY